MPLAYAGAVLFPLAIVGLRRRVQRPHPDPLPEGEGVTRERWIFLGFLLAGVAYGASAPLLLDLTSRLPGFALALNYRLVFLAPLGLAGLAALGADRLPESRQSLGVAATAVAAALMFAYVLAVPVFRERGLTAGFTRPSLAFEVLPVVLLLVASFSFRGRLTAAALLLLVGQRFLEMRDTYPTLPVHTLAPPLSILSALPKAADPYRIVAAGETFRPNAAALYGLEDVRGYESLVLDRFAETFPLWCRPQFASFNRVDDLTRPFLSFLNVRYAIADPATPAPPGWALVARTREGSVFENPRALPRAFVPRGLRVQPDPKRRLEEMESAPDLAEVAWLGLPPGEGVNGDAKLAAREVGTDLIVEAEVRERALVATSIPDWPGWRAKDGDADVPLVSVNHAFVGFWLAPGRHVVRLHYLPSSFLLGALLSAGAVVAVSLAAVLRRRRGLR
jgi:hypothetical protein